MDRDRRLAFLILKEISAEGTWSNLAVKDMIAREDCVSAPFVRELVYGCIRNQKLLDANIDRFLRTPRLKPAERILLRMGFYQLAMMNGVPDHAAVSETVKLASAFMNGRQGFINAVLRSFARGGKQLLADDLSVRYSAAQWIVDLWTGAYGPENAEAFLRNSCVPAPFTVRVNTARISSEALADRLRSEGFEAVTAADSRLCLRLRGGDAIDTEEYRQGLFSVQGEASSLAVELLDPKPGESLLDLCAAPGGKTCAAAELMKNEGVIRASDVHPHRVELIKKEAARLGLDIISAVCADASEYDPSLSDGWDKVIADVPCSGLGTMAKNPEIKLKEMAPQEASEYIKKLADKQRLILKNAAGYVKKGGLVLYATCTVNPAENEQVTESFVKETAGYEIELQRQLEPAEDGREGFYICLIRRNDDQHRL